MTTAVTGTVTWLSYTPTLWFASSPLSPTADASLAIGWICAQNKVLYEILYG